MKRISAFVWAFILLLVACFTAGAFCLGTTKHTGKALDCIENKSAYYTVDMGDSKMFCAVYLNIGAVYVPESGDASVVVKYSTSSTSTTNWKRVAPPLAVSSADAYNWVCFTSGKDLQNVKRLSVSADCNLELNEIVCLDEKGNTLTLAVGKNGDEGADYNDSDVKNTLDSQENFYNETGARYAYTREESDLLVSVANVLSGTQKQSGSIYAMARGYNHFATLLTLPSVAMFGASPFALRLPSLMALAVGVVFLFLLAKELLKEDLYALLIGAAAIVACASIFPATALAYAFGAMLVSAYFAVRFFARGISSKHILRGGLNILFSGIFSAFALAIDTTALFPVLGVLGILACGLVRQCKAYKLALEKAGDNEQNKIRSDYEYKTRVSYCFGVLSFVAVTFLLVLVSAVACYPAILRTYGASTGFAQAMWIGVKTGWRNVGAGGRIRLLKWLVGAGMPVFARVVCLLGLVGFVGATAVTVLALVQKRNEKTVLRARRTYLVLLGSALLSVLALLVKGGVGVVPTPTFACAYLAFLPLAVITSVAVWGKNQ